jgi:hypothetical protein
MKNFLILVLILFVASCSTTPWQRYDNSLFASVFEPSEETFKDHIESLEHFASQESPPPGMCAELAYYKCLANQSEEADMWLQKEVALWPESAQMVAALRIAVESASFKANANAEAVQ